MTSPTTQRYLKAILFVVLVALALMVAGPALAGLGNFNM